MTDNKNAYSSYMEMKKYKRIIFPDETRWDRNGSHVITFENISGGNIDSNHSLGFYKPGEN